MVKVPIAPTIIKIESWMLFDSAFNMPRTQHIGENYRDWGFNSSGTFWMRCYVKNRDGEQYKFRYFERTDGSKKIVAERYIDRTQTYNVPITDIRFGPIRQYLMERAIQTKRKIEKRRTKATVYCNKPCKENQS